MRDGIVYLIVLAGIILISPIASAIVDTDITVKYYSGNSVMLNVLNSDGDLLKSFENDTDSAGNAVFRYTSENRKPIDVSVLIRKEGKLVKMKKFTGYIPGDIIYLDLTVDSVQAKNLTNTAANLTNNAAGIVQNLTNTAANLTNNAAGSAPANNTEKKPSEAWNKTKEIISDYWYYLLGLIVIIVVIYLLIRAWPLIKEGVGRQAIALPHKPEEFRPKTKIEIQLLEAEKKIKQAQAEIDALKNRESKVREAEKKFEEAKRELERAKKGI